MRIVTVNGRSFYFEEKRSILVDSQRENEEYGDDSFDIKRTNIADQNMEIHESNTDLYDLAQVEYYTVDNNENEDQNVEDLYFTDNFVKAKETDVNEQAIRTQTDNEDPQNQRFLDVHNKKRALHQNTPPVEWDQTLADSAQQWAAKLIKENGGKLMHCKTRGDNIGENLFVTMSTKEHQEGEISEEAVEKWYDEIKTYNYGKPSFTSGSGHFTQIIWASSTHVGVGYAQAKIGQFHTLIVCARYKPAGNIVSPGCFEKNVLPLE